MKKIIALIPFLFLIFACTDSELIIDGENVGDGNQENPSTQNSILKTYTLIEPNSSLSFNFDDNGKIKNLTGLNGGLNYSLVISYNDDDLINNVDFSGISDTSENLVFSYDNMSNVTAIQNENESIKISLTTNGNSVSGTYSENGTDILTLAYEFDENNRLLSQHFTEISNGVTIDYTSTYTSGNLTKYKGDKNNFNVDETLFEYDNKINPLFAQTTNEAKSLAFLNSLYLIHLYTDDNVDISDKACYISSLISSSNNQTKKTSINQQFSEISYTYNNENLPLSGVVSYSYSSDDRGTSTYTYY